MRFLSYKLSYFPLERSVFSRVKSTVMEFIRFFFSPAKNSNDACLMFHVFVLYIVEFIDPWRPFTFFCHPQGNFPLSLFSHLLLLLLSCASRENGKKEEEEDFFFVGRKRKTAHVAEGKVWKFLCSFLFVDKRRAPQRNEIKTQQQQKQQNGGENEKSASLLFPF